MYCPDCGNQIPEGKQFCEHCGNKSAAQKVTISKPNPVMIIFGIIIILVIYLIPIFQTGIFEKSLTLAGLFNQCSSPFPLVRCPEYIPLLFFGAWVLGVIFIVLGIFNKKVQWTLVRGRAASPGNGMIHPLLQLAGRGFPGSLRCIIPSDNNH